ncbi:NAD(P) transhydrogenase subunit alpha [Dactylosporangium sp. CA-092794]|uniref:NAD(P) transhydrogenase subunit alpha n=1 Tax=Dactylosporangium sp. CA-092794 TaxID=3239929 RepID=UPI003D92C09A
MGGSTIVGILRERARTERRVALVPDVVAKLAAAGIGVLVETHAGDGAWFGDDAYAAAGATVVSRPEVYRGAGVIACVQPPDDAEDGLSPGQTLLGLLAPAEHPDLLRRLTGRGVTAISLDLLPRTLSRAQSMDALTSQANIAGYRAAVLAAATYGGFFPMLTTAAGTIRPAAVLVLGAGVAGLQAIGTARRLGAVVTAYDVRPESRAEAESVGARFLQLGVGDATGAGGYARALSADEQARLQRALDEQIGRFDVVITTAKVPGRRPPVLVTEAALKNLRPGAVVVDIAAGELGGNVAGSVPDTTVVTDGGVTVVGAGNLPAGMAPAASTAYARNVAALLTHLVRDGALTIDPADEIAAAVVVTVPADGGTP